MAVYGDMGFILTKTLLFIFTPVQKYTAMCVLNVLRVTCMKIYLLQLGSYNTGHASWHHVSMISSSNGSVATCTSRTFIKIETGPNKCFCFPLTLPPETVVGCHNNFQSSLYAQWSESDSPYSRAEILGTACAADETDQKLSLGCV